MKPFQYSYEMFPKVPATARRALRPQTLHTCLLYTSTDKKELQIRDAMGDILKQLPLDLSKKEDAFSKDLLRLMLKQYNLFLESFEFACKNYKGNTNEADIAKVMGFESNDEYNEIMFLRCV